MPYVHKLKLEAMLVLIKAGWSPIDIAVLLLLSRTTVEKAIVQYHRNKAQKAIDNWRR